MVTIDLEDKWDIELNTVSVVAQDKAGPMLLVTTTGNASMDTYAQQLARHISIPKLCTNIYDKQDFGIPLLSWSAAHTALLNLSFVLKLRRIRQPLHLPNHHFGRYGNFLSTPFIVTVADLMRCFDLDGSSRYVHQPNSLDRLYLQLDYRGIRRSKAVIAISNTTKRDLVQYLGIPEERVFVTYLGIDHERFRPVERRFTDRTYVLFVGSEYPYKNLVTLLKAFKLLKQQSRLQNIMLVKVGAAGGREGAFRQRTLEAIARLNLEDDVVITGRVPEDDLPVYYSGAACFVFPSLYEGFGLPPLEAMACGCPVIVSSAGALPEIASPAALVVDPVDFEGIARLIETVIDNRELRQDLVVRGLQHARQFTWVRTAQETLEVYRWVDEA